MILATLLYLVALSHLGKASTSLAGCSWEKYEGTHMTGGSGHIEVTNVEDCAMLCTITPYCDSIDYDERDNAWQDTHCWLIAALDLQESTKNDHYINCQRYTVAALDCGESGYQMVPNVNAEGAVKASSVTVEDCMAQCSADQLCIGFDYNRAAKPWLGVRCWLHHDNREMEVKPVVGTTHYQFVNCDELAPIVLEPVEPEPIPVEPELLPVDPKPVILPVEPEPEPVILPIEPKPLPVILPVEPNQLPAILPVEPKPLPIILPVEPEPVPELQPVESEPVPVLLPVESKPILIEPEVLPIESEPVPVDPEPIPEPELIEPVPELPSVEPEPVPAEPESVPELLPVESKPALVEPVLLPAELEPVPVEPEPLEPEPVPAPEESVPEVVPLTPFQRTVILIHAETDPDEYIFIRGGIDFNVRPECYEQTSLCSLNICNVAGDGAIYVAHNEWSVGDNVLDWRGAEADQGTYNNIQAQGSPAVWTTNNQNNQAYNPLNTFGDHYWMLDVEVDCSNAVDGWFDVKLYRYDMEQRVGQWEADVSDGTCTGDVQDSPSYYSANHHVKCGMLNVFNSDQCQIYNLP